MKIRLVKKSDIVTSGDVFDKPQPLNTRYLLQILRSHVMVRVGGGWDTLQNYLDKHDPCRCRRGRLLQSIFSLFLIYRYFIEILNFELLLLHLVFFNYPTWFLLPYRRGYRGDAGRRPHPPEPLRGGGGDGATHPPEQKKKPIFFPFVERNVNLKSG